MNVNIFQRQLKCDLKHFLLWQIWEGKKQKMENKKIDKKWTGIGELQEEQECGHYLHLQILETFCIKFLVVGNIERVPIKCLKTKTKVITFANQKGWRQSSTPIKTQSNYT